MSARLIGLSGCDGFPGGLGCRGVIVSRAVQRLSQTGHLGIGLPKQLGFPGGLGYRGVMVSRVVQRLSQTGHWGIGLHK